MSDAEEQFTMGVDLAVLESLGINLYSNAAAVLSEVVANAWDADANSISISWTKGTDEIVIEDDGSGMDFAAINKKFLKVGYAKRESDGLESAKFGRPYMGRKGIGKLSIFSLASDVQLFSRPEGGEVQALHITLDALRAAMKENTTYHPDRLEAPEDFPPHGTRIVLSNLNAKRLAVSIAALRRRLARRFDVLHMDPAADDRFEIVINGTPLGFDDREDLRRIEYLWTFGDSPLTKPQTPALIKRFELNGDVDVARGWKLSGWFGTVKTPKQLQDADDEQESLRNIIILARRRPIQEGILDQLHFNKIFGNYVTGQITAEFLDNELVDIATSDRQRLMEDDERVKLLRKVLRERFLEAEKQWSEERPKQKFVDLLSKYPLIHEWATTRQGDERGAAVKLIETIASITLDSENSRKELFRAGILGFERIALESTTDELSRFAANLTADDILPLLANQRSYEDALYVQILRSRIAAIEQLERLIDGGEKERALQEHLFKNMWLLDPSWEHATADSAMEISLRRIRKGLFDVDEEAEKVQGRIDIKYRSAAGTHMIVELKKYDVKTKLDELNAQGGKYWDALSEVLKLNGTPSDQIAVVFVLGTPADLGAHGKQTDEERISAVLGGINGRILYYDSLLNNAKRQYQVYEDSMDKTTDLSRILDSLDIEVDDETDETEPTTEPAAVESPAGPALGAIPKATPQPAVPRPSPALLAKVKRPD